MLHARISRLRHSCVRLYKTAMLHRLGTMATKMVATWRVNILYFIFKLKGTWGQDYMSAVAKKAEMTKRSHCRCFSDFEALWIDGK